MMSPILQRIRKVQGATHALLLARNIGWLFAAVAAAGVSLALLDYLLRLRDPVARWMLSTVFMAAVVGSIWRLMWPILRWRQSPVATARRIERRYPQLGERLSSAVAFLVEGDEELTAGSRQLRRAVIAEAEASASSVDFPTVLDRSGAGHAVAAAAIALGIFAAVAVVSPAMTSLAAARLAAPWRELPWPRKHELAFVDPPARIAAGGDFEVVIVDRRGALPDDLQIQIRRQSPAEAAVESRPIKAVGGKAVFRLENVVSGFCYRARGGDDDVMGWTELAVVEPPRIVDLQIAVQPPEYTGLESRVEGQVVNALVGSNIEIRGNVDRPIRGGRLKATSGIALPTFEIGADGRSFRAPARSEAWTMERSGSCDLELTDENGVVFDRSLRLELRAVEDRPPSIAWQTPTEDVFVTAGASLPIRATVKDDLAVRSVQLRCLQRNQSDEEQVLELYSGPEMGGMLRPASGQEDIRRIDAVWELSRLVDVSPGDSWTIRVTAEDYKPQLATTSARRVTVITREEFENRVAARQSAVLAQLAEAFQMAQQCREQTRSVEKRLGEAQSVVPDDLNLLAAAQHGLRQVDRLVGRDSGGAAGQIAALLTDLATNHLDQGAKAVRLREVLKHVEFLHAHELPLIDHELTEALKSAREAGAGAAAVEGTECAAPPIDEIVQRLQAADEREEKVVQELQRLIGATQQDDRLSRIAHDFGQLFADQERLAADTDDLHFKTLSESDASPAERSAGQQLGQRQLELARRADKLQSGIEILLSGSRLGEDVAATVKQAAEATRRLAIGGRMREAAAELSRLRLGRAREVEQGVLDGIEELITLFQSQGKSSDSGDLAQRAQREKNEAGREGPMDRSTESEAGKDGTGLRSSASNRGEPRGTEGAEPIDAKDAMRRVWGHLPEKVRDQMRATLSEQFLPKYERLIEEYYKRLAEEQRRP